MITLTKNGNAIVFTFSDNAHYLFDGTIEVPVNSLTLITDNSQMATFKKSASNDIFISATYAELGMSKSELESWFKENACGSTGGGGVTSGEVETMIETSLEDYYDIDEVDAALSAKANTATTYTKTEVDNALANKADTATTYTKTEVDNALGDKADTSAVTEAISSAVSGKADTSAVTEAITAAVSGKADTSSVYTKSEVDTALNAKQDTLVSGTNIKTINNESILGSGNIDIQGGGKAINAGRGISVTTGETADTVSFNLPISGLPKTTTAVTDNNLVIFGTGNTVDIESKTNQSLGSNIVCGKDNVLSLAGIKCSLQYNTIFGQGNEIANEASLNASSNNNFVFGSNNKAYGNNNKYNFLFGDNNQIQKGNIHITVFGTGNNPQNQYETIFGKYSVSHTGSTNADKSLFSVGNGTADNARHNAFEIRQNGDIYITSGGTDILLQDALGGGGGVSESAFTSYTAATDARISEDEEVTAAGLNALNESLSGKQDTLIAGSGITISGNVISANGGGSITVDTALDSGSTNPVENRVIYDKFDEVEEVTAAALNALNDKFDGLRLKKLTQAEYEALTVKDNNTLYILVG